MSSRRSCVALPYEKNFPSPDYDPEGGCLLAGGPTFHRRNEDASQLPTLVEELARWGSSEEDLQKILGGNVLRVMRQVAQVSYEMQTGGSSQ
jgi:Membrane dipeptidase (Peptidase family M19)